jgi:hypothetical protein
MDSDSNAKARATAKLEFGIQSSRVNLPVLFGELTDFRTVFSSIMDRLRLQKQWRTEPGLKRATQLLNKETAPGRTLIDALVSLASADLFVQFAVKPLIKDIAMLMKLGEHMQRMRARLAAVTPLRAIASVVDEGSATFSYTNPAVYAHAYSQQRVHRRVVTAWALYQLNWGSLPDPSSLKLGAEVLGVGKLASITWELIPWSFAVDYFIRVGEFLENFDGRIIDVPFTILAQGTSVKRTFHSVIRTDFDTGNNRNKFRNYSAPPTVEGSYEESTYTRTAEVLPIGVIPWPTLRLPSVRQTRNLLDLAFLRGTAFLRR